MIPNWSLTGVGFHYRSTQPTGHYLPHPVPDESGNYSKSLDTSSVS